MRLRTLTAATAVALVASVAPTVAADAAPKKPVYKVSASLSASQADVGKAVKVTGKVAGPKAAKKVLLVQRKVSGGAWKTVAKVRTTKKARYSASVKVATAGRQHVRVVAPKSKQVRQGVSSTRAIVGWRWLDLTSRAKSHSDLVMVGPATIAGTTYSKAIRVTGARITFAVNGACDLFTTGLGVPDGIDSGATAVTFIATSAWGDATPTDVAPNARPTTVTTKLRGATTLGMDVESGSFVAAVNPRVHCSVNTAPALVAELPQ